ncbi:MAG: PEP-CTERM sorting domain-containing protein [Planctomycetes bacterium]|nr:PEP-CTERM sorting domain-containing protein [Planctomycetota bacterium]
MTKRIAAAFFALVACSVAAAQGTLSVDLLDPSETSGTIPDNFKIVDVYVDIAVTDVWTAGGIRAVAQNGGALVYFDADPNRAGTQPGLVNPGLENKFFTSLSRPRARDGNARFTNGGVGVAGGYTGGAAAVTVPNELNVAYFTNPPPSSTSPSVDGYVARISVDISAVGAPDDASWGASVLGAEPTGAVFVLQSRFPFQSNRGTVLATFDVPAISGIDWGLWYLVPEPTSLILLVLGALTAGGRRFGGRLSHLRRKQ